MSSVCSGCFDVLSLLCSGFFFDWLNSTWVDGKGQKEEDLEKIAAQEQKQFQYQTLVAATKNFHHGNKLGEGGFGPVYKV